MAITTDTKLNFEEKLLVILKGAIEKQAEEEFERAKKEMIERFDRSKDQMIATISLNVIKHMSITTFGETITIQLKTESIK